MVLRVEDIRATTGEPWRFISWASNGDFDRYEAALATDPTVESFKCLTELSDRRLYRMVLSAAGQRHSIHAVTVEMDITLLELTVTAESEEVFARFPSREALLEYRDACRERERQFEVLSLYEEHPQEGTTDSDRFGTTAAQREALVRALQRGYFDVPRGTRMEAIAEELDISTAALSTRLRRGQRNLVSHTLAREPPI
jgi:hypothetical protein